MTLNSHSSSSSHSLAPFPAVFFHFFPFAVFWVSQYFFFLNRSCDWLSLSLCLFLSSSVHPPHVCWINNKWSERLGCDSLSASTLSGLLGRIRQRCCCSRFTVGQWSIRGHKEKSCSLFRTAEHWRWALHGCVHHGTASLQTSTCRSWIQHMYQGVQCVDSSIWNTTGGWSLWGACCVLAPHKNRDPKPPLSTCWFEQEPNSLSLSC